MTLHSEEYVAAVIWGSFLKDVEPNPQVRYRTNLDERPLISWDSEFCNTYQLDTYQWQGKIDGRSCPAREGWAEITYSFHF